MSKREIFAALAMQAKLPYWSNHPDTDGELATTCYRIADAMIAASQDGEKTAGQPAVPENTLNR